MRIERTKHGARLVHGRHVVSTLPSRPGPTNSVFDFLAALAITRENKRLAMLGFAAGGTVAPLRALGFPGRIEAVDLSLTGVPTFRRLARKWSGEVTIDRADAVEWLRARSGRFDVVIEDLSVQTPGDVTKPEVSFRDLPSLILGSLTPDGLAVVNVLPVRGMSWRSLLGRISKPFANARLILLDDFDNRILVLGRRLPTSRALSLHLSRALDSIRSRQAKRFRVRTFQTSNERSR